MRAAHKSATYVAACFLFFSSPLFALTGIVIDARNGQVLHAIYPDETIQPNHLTQMMTLYVTFDALAAGGIDPTDTTVISTEAAWMPPSRWGFRAGEEVRVIALLNMVAIGFLHDASFALAEAVGGDAEAFVEAMNFTAVEMCLSNTRFRNPTGLKAPGQQSSVRDLAVLARHLMLDFPEHFSRFLWRDYAYQGDRRRSPLTALRDNVPEVEGIMTSFASQSGYGAAVTARRDGLRVIAVILHAGSPEELNRWLRDLLDEGLALADPNAREVLPSRSGCAISAFRP